MANKRINIQLDFNGVSPLVIKANGTFDKRLSLLNIARLLRGIDMGVQTRALTRPNAVVVQSSLVQATQTFTPAAVAVNDTATIGGTALTAKQLRASGTLTAAGVLANDTCVINGSVFTAVTGAAGPNQFDRTPGTDATTATNLAAAINNSVDPKIKGLIKAKAAAAVVTVYFLQKGTVGNAITLVGTAVRLAASGATLANGAATGANQFDCIGTDIETGIDLARAINASASANIAQVSAVASTSTGVVTITAKQPGLGGNTITTVGTAVRLAAGAATMAGGSAGAPTQWNF